MPFFDVVAVADPVLGEGLSGDANCAAGAALFAGLRVYSSGAGDYRRMLADEHPELVFICSPFDCHIPQALDCLKAGCHVALEIRGGRQLGEYQPLMGFPGKVFPLENIIFRRDILAVREMVRAGLFGEIVSLRGGYRHDLRDELVDANGVLGGDARGKNHEPWRGKLYTTENADIYPTHSIAPLCMIADIHSLASVTSFASKAAGFRERIGDGAKVTMGDIVSTVARTADGTLITLTHDTTLPRPRSYGIEIQGTRGIWDEDNHRIYVEGRSPFEEWEPDAGYIEEYLDPMWRRWGSEAVAADQHHGGMDYIMLKALEEDLRGRSVYPATLSDLALWTSITPLSAKSIAEGVTIDLQNK
jgi:predicted dehydrogenase